jgi:hypothetical protein
MLRFAIRVVLAIVVCTSRRVPTSADQTLHVAQGMCLSGNGLTVLLQAAIDIDLRLGCPTCWPVAVLACHPGVTWKYRGSALGWLGSSHEQYPTHSSPLSR